MILENQIALVKLARGENISLIEYQRLQLSMASLEAQLEVNICAIEGYQEDIEAYQKMALSTVGVVGITVQKLLLSFINRLKVYYCVFKDA